MTRKILFIAFLISSVIGFSQESTTKAPAIEWQKTFEGVYGKYIQQTADGGYVVAGDISSDEEGVLHHHGGEDVLIVKLNDTGVIQWKKALGGAKDDTVSDIQQTKDGGYIVVGKTQSADGDVVGKVNDANDRDWWIVKLDVTGNIQWQKVVGGEGYDEARSVQQTIDGGYVIAGMSRSSLGNVVKDGWDFNLVVLKVSGNGNTEWQKVFGSSDGYDESPHIQQTKDKGFIMVGSSNKSLLTSVSDFNFYVVKLKESGEIQWEKSFGGTNDDYARSVQQTKDGGYIVAGITKSIDGDVTNLNGRGGGEDLWVIKLNDKGNIVWQKAFGDTLNDYVCNIQQTEDMGYIMAGSSGAVDIDATVIKLSESGIVEWQKTMGGEDPDEIHSIIQTKDKGYILTGFGNISGKYGLWSVKLEGVKKNQKETTK